MQGLYLFGRVFQSLSVPFPPAGFGCTISSFSICTKFSLWFCLKQNLMCQSCSSWPESSVMIWAPSCQKTPPSTSPCQVCPHSIFLYSPGLQLHCFSGVFPTLKNNLLLKCLVSSSPIILTVSLLSCFHNGSFFSWCFWIVSEIYILSSSTPRCAGSWKQLLRKRTKKCGFIFIVSQLPWWILIGWHLISILPKCNYLRFQLKVVCIVMLNGV